MYNSNIPPQSELPGTARLIKSTLIAAAAAGVILVAIVMPSEYGIDPTGAGEVLGLKKMGEIKASLAREAAAEQAKLHQVSEAPVAGQVEIPLPDGILTHRMEVILAANESTEIKLKMKKGKQIKYVWHSDSGAAFFDMHADSKIMDIDYHSYGKGTEQQRDGILIAAFDGSHGWYWKNRTPQTMTITLQTNGEYLSIQEMK
ncbi:hypothetical protein MNBD_ALPHA01-485 [hydrothermal vent metagenome]|uniref:Transmembrane anchor protein n=1 Tax=hydrothermal vent metagenome TaxID=652676 RepID=A0A3B0RQ36_9ZZZZ